MLNAGTRGAIDHEIDAAWTALKAAFVQGRVNIHLDRMAGGVTALVGRADPLTTLEAVVSNLTRNDFLAGAITNIDISDIDGAARAAATMLALEDIACTLAAKGQFDRAITFIDAQPVE